MSTSIDDVHNVLPPVSSNGLLAKLDELNIPHRTVCHKPMFTVEDSKAWRTDADGGYSKNLFLRNKKGVMWLVTCHEDTVVNLKQLGELLGIGRVSFSSKERLFKNLGVIPGAVTPFAVINDVNAQVQIALDERLLSYEKLHFHPLDNAKTTTISDKDLIAFLNALSHPPKLIRFDTNQTESVR